MNWNDLLKIADEAGFTPLPVGEYHVVVDKALAKQAQTGKDMINVTFRVLTGPQQDKTCLNNFVLSPESPNAVGFFFRHMAALGIPMEFFTTNPPMANVAAALVGRQCLIEITHREFGGQVRDNVDKIKPVTGAPVPGPFGNAGGPVPAPTPVPAATPAPAYIQPAAPTPQAAPAAPAPAPAAVPQPAPAAVPAVTQAVVSQQQTAPAHNTAPDLPF